MAAPKPPADDAWQAATRHVKPLRKRPAIAVPAPAKPMLPPPKSVPVATPANLAPAVAALDRASRRKIGRGNAEIEARLDLHGMTQAEAHRALVRFVIDAGNDGMRLALVITGKGRAGSGVLRQAVPRWLDEPALRQRIVAVSPASPRHGGDGALYLQLRRAR